MPDDIRMARVSFPAFCNAIGKPNATHHQLWVDAFVTGVDTSQLLQLGGPNTAVLAPRGPLDAETPVATPDGWRPLKDIRPHDLVYADDGTPTKVLATVDYSEAECWEVVLSDGTSVICDDSHRWDVRRMGTDEKGEWRTVTLQEIRQFVTTGLKGNCTTGVQRTVRLAQEGEKPWLDSRGYPRYQVPIAAPVQYPERPLPVDPYLLGVLLGDGALSTGSVRFHKNEPDLIERVAAALPEECELKEVKPGTGDYRIVHRLGKRCPKPGDGSHANPITQALADMGLWGSKSHEKFIPTPYLLASVGQRIALLQGLLDTDGTCAKKTGRGGVTFGTSSPWLMEGITELVRSLGGLVTPRKPYESGYRRANGERVACRTSYRCGIRLPDKVMPFHISRKAELYLGPSSGRSNGGLARSIVDIRPAGQRQTRCLTVDHPSERFVVEDYAVSKNSAKSTLLGLLVAWAIGIHADAGIMLRMLYLAYSLDIARSRSHTIKNLISSTRYREIFPKVRLSKERSSDELWSIDYDFAGIDPGGDDPYTLVGQGLSGSITSRRSQLIVLDDVIKSSRSIENPSLRQVLITNWNEVVRPTLIEGGRCIALGTRFSTVDIFHTTFNEKNGWRVLTQRAIVQDEQGQEKSYWPEWVSLEYLRKLREEDPISFSFQFQNQPVSTSALDFPRDWLVAAPLQTEHDAYCVGIDLSSGLKERNDWTVFTLGGRRDEKVQAIDYRRMRAMGNLEKIDLLCEMLLDWGLIEKGTGSDADRWYSTDVTVTINIEATSYQRSLKADAEEILIHQRGLTNLVLRPIDDMSGDKLSRLRGRLGLFQLGRITWNELINWEPYWNELLNFQSCDHDDCPDSMLLMLRGLVGQGQIQTAWDRWVLPSAG